MSVRYQAQPSRQRPRDPRERPTKTHSVGLPSPYNAPAGSSSAPSASTARTPRPSSSLAHAPVGPSPYDYLPTGRPAPNSVSISVSTTPAPGQSSRGWYQVDPRRPLSPDELTDVNTISARPVATIHDLSDKLLRRMIAFYDVYDDEMGTVSSIFERTGLLKDFGWVCSRWRRIARDALFKTVNIYLPRVSPNLSPFTSYLWHLKKNPPLFSHLRTLAIHYGDLPSCPLVSPYPPLRPAKDWTRETELVTKPGETLDKLRGFRQPIKHLILDTDGDTFVIPMGLENMNWDELTSVTYAAKRFSHTGITQNGGRKERFPFDHLKSVKIYTEELDEDVLRQVYLYLLEFGPKLRSFTFHHASLNAPPLEMADIVNHCPNLEELVTEPPDRESEDVHLWRLKRLVVGSPMMGEPLRVMTGFNFIGGVWTDEVLAMDDEEEERSRREKEEREVRAEAERRKRALSAHDIAAWE